MANLAEIPKADLVTRLERSTATLRRLKEQSSEIGERALNTGCSLLGSFGGGVAIGRGMATKTIPGTDIPLLTAGAGVLTALGVVGMLGRASDPLCALGTGVLGADLAVRGVSVGQKMGIRAQK